MPVSSVVGFKTWMSPKDDTTAAFINFVQGAKESIFVQIYGFHLPKLTDILIAKHQAGVEVSVILDHSQEQGKAEQGEVDRLVAAGVPTLVGTSYEHGQILHLKATVVDRSRVMHGSWNYSLSASFQLNDLHEVDSPDLARFYLSWHDAIRLAILLHEQVSQPAGEVIAPAAYAESDEQVDALLADTPVAADLAADLAKPAPLGSAVTPVRVNTNINTNNTTPDALSAPPVAVIAASGVGVPVKRPAPSTVATARVRPKPVSRPAPVRRKVAAHANAGR